jgi:two-component system, OmpR family, response regulator
MQSKEKITVLLIDDDDDVLNTLGKMVEQTGWVCFKAPTGEIGVDLFKVKDVDVVVLDINLPKMDGFDVLKQIKQLKPSVPVIMLTGLGYEKGQVDMALTLGASGYVAKAMPVKSVISKIKSVLGHK